MGSVPLQTFVYFALFTILTASAKKLKCDYCQGRSGPDSCSKLDHKETCREDVDCCYKVKQRRWGRFFSEPRVVEKGCCKEDDNCIRRAEDDHLQFCRKHPDRCIGFKEDSREYEAKLYVHKNCHIIGRWSTGAKIALGLGIAVAFVAVCALAFFLCQRRGRRSQTRYEAVPIAGQPYPVQQYPAQQYPVQQYPAPPYAAQPYPTQPYPGQRPPPY